MTLSALIIGLVFSETVTSLLAERHPANSRVSKKSQVVEILFIQVMLHSLLQRFLGLFDRAAFTVDKGNDESILKAQIAHFVLPRQGFGFGLKTT